MLKLKKKPKKAGLRLALRCVAYPEGRQWLAHCLELDIVAEGPTVARAVNDLIDLCELQIHVASEEGDIESVFTAAPPEIWKLYFLAREKPELRPSNKRPSFIDRLDVREFEFA
jgi:hypothetical protein